MPLLLLAVALALSLTACSGADDDSAADPAGSGADAGTDSRSDPGTAPPPAPADPASVPAAPGPVRTRNLVTVIDTGDGPQACLGAIAESYPPQCSGPPVAGWRFADYEGAFDTASGVRFGQFALTGTWDGTTLTVTDAIPAALYDPAPVKPFAPDAPTIERSTQELQAIADEVGSGDVVPGTQGAYVDRGRVLVDVIYDDGSLQAVADDAYSGGVVDVQGLLVDA